MPISTVKLSTEVRERFRTAVTCGHDFIIDQPRPMGGDEGPNPLEVFLSALGGCICAIGRIIAQQEKLPVEGIRVAIEGDIDKAFLMGSTTEGRAGFTAVRVWVEIDGDLSPQAKQDLLERIEARCPIADNMVNGTAIQTSLA